MNAPDMQPSTHKQTNLTDVRTLRESARRNVEEGAVTRPFLVATDARRKEVYWAAYDERGVRLGEPAVSRPADIATDAPVVGSGAVLYPDFFPRAVGPE